MKRVIVCSIAFPDHSGQNFAAGLSISGIGTKAKEASDKSADAEGKKKKNLKYYMKKAMKKTQNNIGEKVELVKGFFSEVNDGEPKQEPAFDHRRS